VVVISRGRVVAEGAPREALSKTVLADVFGLDGELVDTPAGLVLAARRL
jgi:iron complex transport system ATP-binding protein